MTLQQIVDLCRDTMQAKDFWIAIWKEDRGWKAKSFSLDEYTTCLKEKTVEGFNQKLHPDAIFINSTTNIYLKDYTQKQLHDFIKNLYYNQNNKDKILDTDFGSELEMTIAALDFYHPEQGQFGEHKDFDICLAKWEIFQIALKQFYGINYYFVRDEEYYGLCITTAIRRTDENTHWLIKKKHLNLSTPKQDIIEKERKEESTNKAEPLEAPSAGTKEMTDEEVKETVKKIFELCLEVNQSRYRKTMLSKYELTVCFNFFGRANAIGIAILSSNRLCDETFRLCLSKPDRERKNFQQCIKSLEDLKNQLELSC